MTPAVAVSRSATPPEVRLNVTRLPQNPLVTIASSATLGDNVNGPSIVRVPSWVERPLGRYYMYFAHHKGAFIRLAYADAIQGPWRIYEPGVLHVRDSAFYRPQPDPPGSPEGFYTHVASPEVYLDETRKKVVMWFHGWWTDGRQWPLESAVAARSWARTNGYGQFTQVAESDDGVRFTIHPVITKESYLRVFREKDWFYGLARLGVALRGKDPAASFGLGTNPFRDSAYAGRVRHVALTRRDRTLFVFFTAIGDAPERILMSTIDLEGGWENWRASPPIEVLRPEAPYECPNLPAAPSLAGDVEGRVNQIRDPAIFEEAGRTWLFYTICGEQGIAGGEIRGI